MSAFPFPKPGIRLKRRQKAQESREADALWRKAVKTLAGWRCEKCRPGERQVGLEAHHVFSRANKALRQYLPNGIALCLLHHDEAHADKKKFRDWAIRYRGLKWWTDLIQRKRAGARGLGQQ